MSIQSEIALSMSSKVVQERLKQQLEKTSTALNEAYNEISDVGHRLKQRPHLAKFEVQWSEFSVNFRVHQWSARDTAVELDTSLDQINTAVLPPLVDGRVSTKQLLEIVNHFIESTYTTRDLAAGFPKQFEESKESAINVSLKLDAFLAEQDQKIYRLETEIHVLEKRRAQIRQEANKIKQLIGALEHKDEGIRREIDFLRHHIEPTSAEKIVRLEEELRANEEKIAQLKRQLSELLKQLEHIEKEFAVKYKELQDVRVDRSAAQDIRERVAHIADHGILNVIRDIYVLYEVWGGLNNDTDAVKRYIENQSSDVPAVVKAFELEGTVYDILAKALKEFSVGVGRYS